MKRILSAEIGSYGWFAKYSADGTPSIFINKNVAYCRLCHCRFIFDFYYPYDNVSDIYCPKCGRRHENNEIMYSNDYDTHLPYKTEFVLLEYKNKLSLKIKYQSVSLNGKDIYPKINNIKEIYTFDILNESASWEKYAVSQKEPIEKMDIGYITDYENLKEKTALWYFGIRHKVKKDVKLSSFLKLLRDKITLKEKQIHGYSKRSFYIVSGISLNHLLFANILNAAHKVRFWDGGNMDYSDDFLKVKERMIDSVVDRDFEQKTYKIMKTENKTYHQAVLSALSLPHVKNVMKNFSYRKLYLLTLIYAINDIGTADTVFEFYAKNRPLNIKIESEIRYIEKLKKVCEFFNEFYLKYYRNLKPTDVLKDEYRLQDIMNLWNEANKKTRFDLKKENIPFRYLHDWLSFNIAKQPEKDTVFHIPENVLSRFNLYMANSKFKCRCINNYSYLKYVAETLRNCSAGYKNRISERLQLVVITDDKGKPKILLEIQENSIIQAKMFSNIPVKKNAILNELVVQFAKKTGLDIATKDINQEVENKENNTVKATA